MPASSAWVWEGFLAHRKQTGTGTWTVLAGALFSSGIMKNIFVNILHGN